MKPAISDRYDHAADAIVGLVLVLALIALIHACGVPVFGVPER